MKSSTLQALCLLLLVSGCAASHAVTAPTTLTLGGKTLSLPAPTTCTSGQRSKQELARYLSQYDPSQDPKADIYDETARTKEEIQLIKDALVEDGFRYPNGQESVITWMDFDADGVCDFTASAGIGGMRSTDRMFLFRGLPKADFRLVDAYHTYMEGSTILVPYIPIAISGEKFPLLVSRTTLMQWQAGRKQLATCASISYGPQAAQQRRAAPSLAALCSHQQEVYTWAADQLPHKNEIPH